MLLASLLLVASQGQAPAADRPHPMDLGPRVGQQLPTFEATDQTGRARTFASLKGPNGLVFVFFRSADW